MNSWNGCHTPGQTRGWREGGGKEVGQKSGRLGAVEPGGKKSGVMLGEQGKKGLCCRVS